MLVALSLTSVGYTGSLVGSKQSVNETSFCKKYKCVLKSTETSTKPDSYNWKGYTFSTAGNGELVIHKDANGVARFAGLFYKGQERMVWLSGSKPAFINDFALSFYGISSPIPLADTCVSTLLKTPEKAINIMAKSNGFTLACMGTLTDPVWLNVVGIVSND